MNDMTPSYRLTRDRLESLECVPLIERHWKKIDKLDNKITIHQTLARAPSGRIIETFRIRPSEQESGPVTQLYLRQYNEDGVQEGLCCMYATSHRKPGKDKAQHILDGATEKHAHLVPATPYGYRKLFRQGVEVHHEAGVDLDFAQYCHDVTAWARKELQAQQDMEAAADMKNRHILHVFLNASPVKRIGAVFNPALQFKFS